MKAADAKTGKAAKLEELARRAKQAESLDFRTPPPGKEPVHLQLSIVDQSSGARAGFETRGNWFKWNTVSEKVQQVEMPGYRITIEKV